MAKRDGPLAFGRPHSSDDRLQADAVLIRGPDLDRLVRVLGRFLRDHRGPLFPKAALSAGVAEAGWRGCGFCTDQPIAVRASQAPPGSALTLKLSRRPPLGWSTAPRRAGAHASGP